MKRPEHIVETRFVHVDGYQFKQPRTFIDGEQASFEQMETLGWRNVSNWQEQSKRWNARMSYPAGPEAWDKTQEAFDRVVKLVGEREGEPMRQTALFEVYLQQNGWEPFLMDRLNKFCPGVCLIQGKGILFTHVFVKGDQSISFRLGDANRFVFSMDKVKWYQVPVGADHFEQGVKGELPVIEDWGVQVQITAKP